MARREASLHDVASKAKDVGSPDVLVVAGDVANPEDCKRFVHATVEHFGQCKLITADSYLRPPYLQLFF